ncbi:MAG: metal ABC transporter substrate-binding protein [Chloroflexota bacterium]
MAATLPPVSRNPGGLRPTRRAFLLGLGAATLVPRVSLAQTTPISVVASTPVVADLVANVAGDRASVHSVVPTSGDPHTYETTPRDLAALSESKTFIFVGGFLEAFLETSVWGNALRDAKLPTLRLLDRADPIVTDTVIDHGDHVHDTRSGDPHVWLDPLRAMLMIQAIGEHLTVVDQPGAAEYRSRADAYGAAVADLHAELDRDLGAIPRERRRLIVLHDAYRYFAQRYGFEVIGYVVKNPGQEPSAKQLAELTALIDSANASVVFKEPQLNARILEQLAADRGLRVGDLLTDSFAGRVNSYLGLMRFNRDSLLQHLANS